MWEYFNDLDDVRLIWMGLVQRALMATLDSIALSRRNKTRFMFSHHKNIFFIFSYQ